MHSGLGFEDGSMLKMPISFVNRLPIGDERGLFYTLEVLTLAYYIDEEGRVLKQTSLANFIASGDEDFHLLNGKQRELGFTFLFLVKQTSIASNTLIKWTKGFNVNGILGEEVVDELTRFNVNGTVVEDLVGELTWALQRQGIDMQVVLPDHPLLQLYRSVDLSLNRSALSEALTYWRLYLVGFSAARPDQLLCRSSYFAFRQPCLSPLDRTTRSVTQTNLPLAYLECADAIKKRRGPLPNSGEMVINMEWGNFRSSYLLTIDYDHAVDAESLNLGEQIYEKLISEMYLSEIVQRVLLRLTVEAALFGDSVPPQLEVPFVLQN
ncbi:hypothetical protein ZIOFF_025339 [Zingiber officinale]|uniref:Phosphotransferase n=1 Tax=Zingiber officinale TaxID=94328 RepID=A0A8J5H152_ZINOF|nr:hypothetical protein ZIOFF_025339 [Zingiber officinale]